MTDVTQSGTPRVKRAYTRRAPVREAEVREEPVRKTRQRVRKSGADVLHVPQNLIPEGMDYQWVTSEILQQPSHTTRAGFEINGWEPVPATRHDGMWMPKGFKGEINVGGLVLMERPMELTLEARQEEREMARQAVGGNTRSLSSGEIPGVSLDTQHPSARKVTGLTREVIRGIPVPD